MPESSKLFATFVGGAENDAVEGGVVAVSLETARSHKEYLCQDILNRADRILNKISCHMKDWWKSKYCCPYRNR